MTKAPVKSTITLDRGIELPATTTTERKENNKKEEEDSVENGALKKLKNKEKVFQVTIKKRDNGLGLSLAGGQDSDICYGGW